MPLKPFMTWVGGKQREIRKFEHHIPDDYDTYIEPFIGGGALYFHLEPQKAVINDTHVDLINLYRAVQNGHGRHIYNFLKDTPKDKDTFQKIREETREVYTRDTLEYTSRFLYLSKTNYRGTIKYNKDGKIGVSYGYPKYVTNVDTSHPRYINLLRNTEIYNTDYKNIFDKYNDRNNFMFLDPPYDCKLSNYGFNDFGRTEQIELAQKFKETKIRCLMVIAKTDFIEEQYREYIVEEYHKRYDFNNESVTHLIIKNF